MARISSMKVRLVAYTLTLAMLLALVEGGARLAFS